MVDGQARRSTVLIGRTGKNVVNYMEGHSLFPAHEMRRFDSIQPATINDSEGICGNDKFTAFAWERKGCVAVLPSYDYKRLPFEFPMIKGHKGGITSMEFSPFQDRLLATGCEDGMVRCFVIDEGGIKADIMEADVELEEHARKVLAMNWHNSVENLMATSSVDKTVKVWDVNQADTAFSLNMDGAVTQMQWGPNGDVLGCMVKDTVELALIDPRDESSKLSVKTNMSARYQRMQWINEDSIMTFGFNNMNKRTW